MARRFLFFFSLITILAFAGIAQSATFIVTTTQDVLDADSLPDGVCDTCSLREAIQEANALPGPDTILVPPGLYELTRAGLNENGNLTGDLDVFDDVSIIGLQDTHLESQVGRVIHVFNGNVVLTGLTLRNGDAAGENPGPTGGGGIYYGGNGSLTVNNCTVTENQGKGGAGIFMAGTGTLSVNGSTLVLNAAGGSTRGGAIQNVSGTMIVTNSTITGNNATGAGGGIYSNGGALTLNNVTITDNQAGGGEGGGGIAVASGTVTINNTIVFDNIAPGPNDDCEGTFTSGYNLIGDTDGCAASIVVTDITGMDPLLGPLQNNGGITFTHALGATSPAIDKGDPTEGNCEDTDQRGLTRPQDGDLLLTAVCDIGAYEVFAPCPAITLSPTELPVIIPGVYFSQTFTPSGGVGPYTFAVTAGMLPAGLYLDPITGILSGVPLEGGSYSFTVTAFDSNLCPGSQVYSFSCPDITLSPTLLPEATQNQSYSETVTADGGTAPYQYTITAGFLPPGMSLDVSSGQLSGTPTFPGIYFFTITATDSLLCTGTQGYVLTVQCAVVISPSTLPDGTESVPYSEQLTATGGSGIGYSFSVLSGTLPPGLSLSGPGLLSGTPTTPGDYTFVVQVTDSVNCLGTILYQLTIHPCIVITPEVLPGGVVGTLYSQALTAVGGTGPYTFTHTGGNLPSGVNLAADGMLSGTPDTAGIFTFDVQVADSGSCTVTQTFTIVISPVGCPTITITPATVPNGVQDTVYSQALTGDGGTGPYTFVLVGGSLPPGLSMDAAGLISGTPTTPGVYDFTVTAADDNFCATTQSYTMVISPTGCPTITLSPTTLPDGQLGVAYSQTVAADGGSPAYTYNVVSGALPDGLTLDSLTGDIAGTPTVEGDFTFTIVVIDSNLCFGSQTYTVSITTGGGGGSCSEFLDEFTDGTVDWTVLNPGWTESGGTLIGTPTGGKALIHAGSVYSGCNGNCTFRAKVQTAGGALNKVWMLAWYTSNSNTVEVLFKEENDKIIVKQRSGGSVVAKGKVLITLLPNTFYNTQITFDGTKFTLNVDGVDRVSFNAVGGVNGTSGFKVKNTTGTFDDACVNIP